MKKKLKKSIKPKRKVLCRIYGKDGESDGFGVGDNMIVYTDGTWRWTTDKVEDIAYYRITYDSQLGPMFFFKTTEDDSWRTEWKSTDAYEVRLANTIAKAQVDLEVDKLLKSST